MLPTAPMLPTEVICQVWGTPAPAAANQETTLPGVIRSKVAVVENVAFGMPDTDWLLSAVLYCVCTVETG